MVVLQASADRRGVERHAGQLVAVVQGVGPVVGPDRTVVGIVGEHADAVGQHIGALDFHALVGGAAAVGLVGLAGDLVGERLDLMLEVDPVEVAVEGELAQLEHRAHLIVGRFLGQHLGRGQVVYVKFADIGDQEALGVFGVGRPVARQPVVHIEERQGLGEHLIGGDRLGAVGQFLDRRVQRHVPVHVLDPGADRQGLDRLPFEFDEGLILGPAGELVVRHVQRHLGIGVRGAGGGGRLLAEIGEAVQQVDVDDVAVAVRALEVGAEGQDAERQGLAESGDVAEVAVLVLLAIAGNAEGLQAGGVGLARGRIDGAGRRRHQIG